MRTRSTPYVTDREFPPLFALLGAHGGSGAGTLARMWAPAVDAEHAWPGSPATTQRVVVVCRETMAGISAAAHVLRTQADLAPSGVSIHGLITVAAKPGARSRDISRYARTVAELVDWHHRIPWAGELVELLPSQLPIWQPGDTPLARRRWQVFAPPSGLPDVVPNPIAEVGEQICKDFAATRAEEIGYQGEVL